MNQALQDVIDHRRTTNVFEPMQPQKSRRPLTEVSFA